jgi:hypothetical protein
MTDVLHGRTCTIVLFEELGEEIEALFVVEGVLVLTPTVRCR